MTQETGTQKKAHVVQSEPEVKKDMTEKKSEVAQVEPEIQKDAAEQKIEPTQIERKPVLDSADDDTKRSGIKEIAVDSEAIVMAKDEMNEKKQDTLPSFFVEENERTKVVVDILSSKADGKIMSVSRAGLGLNFAKDFAYLKHSMIWFDFTVPSYEDMSTYRQRSASYRREAGQMLVDRLQLRNFLLVWHLKDWSLMDKQGKKIELKHDEGGSLSDESLKRVYSFHSTILDVVLTIFEKDILLT